jgi:NAD(P)H-dependent flavin oxidoreductase YrpB (nitropropane dioxygenase family)
MDILTVPQVTAPIIQTAMGHISQGDHIQLVHALTQHGIQPVLIHPTQTAMDTCMVPAAMDIIRIVMDILTVPQVTAPIIQTAMGHISQGDHIQLVHALTQHGIQVVLINTTQTAMDIITVPQVTAPIIQTAMGHISQGDHIQLVHALTQHGIQPVLIHPIQTAMDTCMVPAAMDIILIAMDILTVLQVTAPIIQTAMGHISLEDHIQ